MSERMRLPEGLARMAPGPELAAGLATVDPSRLNGHDLVELAPAYERLIAHLQANLATVLNQIQHSPPGDVDSGVERTEHPHRWAEVEIAAKLHWSAGKAGYQLRYAHHLVRRLPMVHAALAAGEIDFHRARVIVDGVLGLADVPAQLIAGQVLADGAGRWSVRKLAGRLRRLVIAFDAEAAVRRRRLRQAERRVQVEPHPDGTADLSGLNLPPERVAEIVERITAIARTAKRLGDQRTMDQLRADVLCDLLAGTGIGATPPAPLTNPGPTGHPDLDDTDDTDTVDTDADDTDPADEPADAGAGDGAGEDAGLPLPLPGPRRGVIELLAPLSTLVGASALPGEITGFGPVAADIVAQFVAAHPEAQWRFSIFDDDSGEILHHGITHVRPDPPPERPGRDRSGFSAADVAFIRARDRTCRGPQDCTAPASACETDHTQAKVDGGGHDRDNGGPLCKREHMFKHQSGATLEQPEPGVFRWTTPLGHTYVVKPEPYIESTGPPGATARRLTRILTAA